MLQIQLFVYLQLLDVMTTLIGMRIGLGEASPFIRHLMQMSPAAGLLLSKVLAILLCSVCLWLNKRRLLSWVNYWYAGVVVWNMSLIAIMLKVG